MDRRHKPFTLSGDTETICDELERVPIGGSIDYSKLSKLIGADVQNEARNRLTSARKILLRDNRMVFETISNIGLKRLSDEEIVKSAGGTVTRVRRMARRGAEKLSCVADFEAMPNDKKLRHNALVSTFGIVHEMLKTGSIKRIEVIVEKAKKRIPCEDLGINFGDLRAKLEGKEK